jgi:hypothetical protein
MVSMFVVLMSLSCASAASTVYVNTTGNDTTGNGSAENPFLTIQKGVDNVTNGDTIIIAHGQYNGTGNTNLTINKNMIIIGERQADTVINGTDTSWIFLIQNGFNVTIQNLTLTNGNSSGIGGAINNQGNCVITNCNFKNNYADAFGGAIVNGGVLNLENSIFSDNNARTDGGALENYGNITAKNCIFHNNTVSRFGGAIDNWHGYFTAENCDFTANNASSGGAIYNLQMKLNVSYCNFIGNNATYGGAISNDYGNVSAHFNRFYNNTATNGTAIYYSDPINVGLFNATDNWWGSNNPLWENLINSTNGTLDTSTWLYMTINATPNRINDTLTSLITVSFNNRFDGTTVTPFDSTEGHIPDGTPVDFSLINAYFWPYGSLNESDVGTVNGTASVLFTASYAGVQYINASTDDQNVTTNVTIDPAAYLRISKEFRDAPWGSVITSAYYNQKIYALVKVRNNGPDAASFSVLDVLSGLNWTGNYYVLSAVGSYIPTPDSWVPNDSYNSFNGTHWTVPSLGTFIGSERWLAIECIVKAVGVNAVSNQAQTINQTAYAYNGFASYKANLTTVPTPTKTFTLSVKNTGTGRIKAVYYVTVYRPDNAAPIFKKYLFYLNPGKSTSFNIGTYALGTAISTDEFVYNYAYSRKTVSLVNTWTATGLAPYVQNFLVANVPASVSKGTIARKRFWINQASLGVQIVVPPKLM